MSITITYYLSLNSPWTYMGSGPFAEIAPLAGQKIVVPLGDLLLRQRPLLAALVARREDLAGEVVP